MSGFRGKTVIVTGGSGFLGTHLRAKLAKPGVNIINMDIVESPCLDVTKKESFRDMTADLIFHLAGITSPNQCEADPQSATYVNVNGTLNVLEYAARMRIGVVYPSSIQVYGEPDFPPVDENCPLRPLGIYGLTKAICESICDFYREKRGIRVSILRLANAYGPRQRRGFIVPDIITQALTNRSVSILSSKPSRDFVFVDDAIDAFCLAGELLLPGPFNISSGKETTVGELVRIICESTQARVSSQEKTVLGPSRLCASNSLARKELGWRPHTRLEDGLRKAILWYSGENAHE